MYEHDNEQAEPVILRLANSADICTIDLQQKLGYKGVMATLQVLSNSRIKNRDLNYDETIIMKMREDFINYVDPNILLLHFHILSPEDEERIDAQQKREGRSSAARLLLQLLPHYPEWLPRLLESLLHPDVRLEHLAEKIKQSLEEVMMDIDIDEDNAMEVDPDSPPSSDAIGELSSFLVPEGSGLHALRWNEEQFAQYITSAHKHIAERFFIIFFSTVNQMIQEMVDTFRERERLDMIVTSFAIGCLEIFLRLKSPQDVQKLRELLQTGALYQALEGTVLTRERQLWLVQEAKKYGLQWRRLTLKITISEEHLQRCEQYLASKHEIHPEVQISPLTMNGKQVCEELGSTILHLPEEERTVEIRGLQADDVEIVKLYFENPRKGGDDIENCQWDDKHNVLYITFTDAKVAGYLVSKSHTVLGKVLDVQISQPQHEESCTVEVRGFDPSKIEAYRLYFENPRKGGGEIEDLSLNEDGTVMLITFETHEVAAQVAQTPHTVLGRELQVNLASKKDAINRTSTVMIEGCDLEKEELYRLYFENPKHGGGDIKEISVDSTLQIIYITFQDWRVAEKVANLTHTISGRELYVQLISKDDVHIATFNTVMVKGCDLKNEDLCRMYFENAKYGGGDIEDLTVDEELQAFYITFKDPEVAKEVCRRQHKIKGHDLEVTLHRLTSSDHGKALAEPFEEQEEQAPRTVEVTVGNPIQSKDTYLYYFENKRRGGGEVESIDINEGKGKIYVTFASHEVAKNVASMQHTVNGQTVEVKLYSPRPTDTKKLLFGNVKDTTTRGLLSMFIENVTGFEPEEIIYSDEPGFVLAAFREEPVFDKVQEKCLNKTLEDNQLSVTKVSISNCLLVENLNPDTRKDTILMYFESKRSLGGPVERVEMMTGENRCLVFFEDHKVIDNVLSKTHVIDENTLTVRRYIECLGPSGGRTGENIFTLPKPLEVKEIDSCKLAFVYQSSTAQDDFKRQLSICHAVPHFAENTLTVECTLTSSVPNARTLARAWPQNVKQAVNKYMDLLDVHTLEITQEIWQEVEKAVSSISASNKDSVVISLQPQERIVVVVGIKDVVKKLSQQISATNKSIKETVERESKKIEETDTSLKPFQLRLLEVREFPKEVEKLYKDLTVSIRLKEREIIFHGSSKDINLAKTSMNSLLQTVQTITISEMSQLQVALLSNNETLEYIQNKFKAEMITAVLEQKDDIVTVYAFSDSDIENARRIVQKSIVQHSSDLSEESAQVLQTKEWREFLKTTLDTYSGKLLISNSHDCRQLFIIGTDDILEGVVDEVLRFIEENTIYTEVYSFSPNLQKFLYIYWRYKLLSTVYPLKSLKVQLTFDKDGIQMSVRGTEKGLEMVKSKLQELQDKIIRHVEVVSESNQVKFLSMGACIKDLETLGRSSQCVVAFTEESNTLQVLNSNRPNGQHTALVPVNVVTISSFDLSNRLTIAVAHGDLTQLSVDVFVRFQKSQLDHASGLAKHTLDAGAKSLGSEISMIEPGELPCESIIQAVCPVLGEGRSGLDDWIYNTIIQCLEKTTKRGYTSIAIPALSSGNFSHPVDEYSRAMMQAVKDYLGNSPQNTIQTIYVCDADFNIVRHFCSALQNTIPEFISCILQPPPKKVASFTRKAAEGLKDSLPKDQHKLISVSILDGEIAKQEADVIVNSTSDGLDLKKGGVSKSILEVGGQELQEECRARYPRGIPTGEIACTSPHGLKCKKLFHIALCNFTNPSAEKILHDLMTSCLREASKSHYTSIAFPALGTGMLEFPPPVVAKTMLGAINSFQETTPASTLREVKIVVFKDPPTVQEFQKVYSESGMVADGHSKFNRTKSVRRATRKFSERGVEQSVKPESVQFEIYGLNLIIKQGDITEEDVDAIVNSTNNELDLSRGAVASALKIKCGNELVKECGNKVPEIKGKGVTRTKAFNLKCKLIIHVSADYFKKEQAAVPGRMADIDWMAGIAVILQETEVFRARSIAMPALGTGAHGRTPTQSANDLFNALVKFLSDKKRTLEEIRVVIFDKDMIPLFVNALQAVCEKHNASEGKELCRLKGLASPSGVQTPRMELKLYVYAAGQNHVQTFLTAFADAVKSKFTRKEINDETLSRMSSDQILEIQSVGREHNVDLQIVQVTGRIVIIGLHSNVSEALNKITHILRQALQSLQEGKTASVLANMVHWHYMEDGLHGTEPREYGKIENHIIEMAYQNNQKSVEIIDTDKNVYIIDFDSLTEYPRDDPSDTVLVVRKDMIKGLDMSDLPPNWAPFEQNELMKLVKLESKDEEFKQVVSNLKTTLGKTTITVTSIERVQNPILYRQYQAKKSHMERQNINIQNERTLWHGTAGDAIHNINQHGFSRSYCGKNAVAFGQGVYFAVNSSYSAGPTFTPPDTSGKRYLYQCKVLVGHSTLGNSDLRVLPARDKAILFDSATNDLKNPIMYVIFHDTQAYPEYLITFK